MPWDPTPERARQASLVLAHNAPFVAQVMLAFAHNITLLGEQEQLPPEITWLNTVAVEILDEFMAELTGRRRRDESAAWQWIHSVTGPDMDEFVARVTAEEPTTS